MGYEIKLYVGSFSSIQRSDFSIHPETGEYHNAYKDKGAETYCGYEADGETVVALPAPTLKATYFSPIAMFDLCKPGYESTIYELDSVDNGDRVFFYSDDGNTPILKDRYDKLLRVHTIEDVLEALKKDAARDSYRRFDVCIPSLEVIAKKFNNAKVVFFGY